jgi:hypothetical protein
MLRRLALLVITLLPLVAVAAPHVYLDHSLRSGAPLKTVVILSPDVEVSEISAGGVIQKVAAWSENARRYVTDALRHLAAEDKFKVAALPALSADEQASLDQHVALYNVVASNVLTNSLNGGDVWTRRLESGLTDYTVGPGLAFIADKTGADSALLVIVRDYESSGGRKAMMVFGALFGVLVPTGRTFTVAGLVDLRTGTLLWQSYDTSVSPDMRVQADVVQVVDGLFSSYPTGAGRGR